MQENELSKSNQKLREQNQALLNNIEQQKAIIDNKQQEITQKDFIIDYVSKVNGGSDVIEYAKQEYKKEIEEQTKKHNKSKSGIVR